MSSCEVERSYLKSRAVDGGDTEGRAVARSSDHRDAVGLDVERAEAGSRETDKEMFTVDEAVESIGFGRFQLTLSVFTGMIWMVDAMEVMIISIVSPAARCSFHLTDVEEAMITTVVFLGVMVGSPVWGYFCDKYGRHKSLMLSSVFIGLYGFASAFSPNYFWLLALRFCTGFNIACTSQAMTYYAEFLPPSVRGICIVFIEVFWSVGTCFESVLAMYVMPKFGWRYLLGFSALPVTLSVIVFAFFPESPHFLMATGKKTQALTVLRSVAMRNRKPMPKGLLVSGDVKRRHEEARTRRSRALLDGEVEASHVVSSDYETTSEPPEFLTDSGNANAPLLHPVNPETQVSVRSRKTASAVSTASSKKSGIRELWASRELGVSLILLCIIWFVLAFVYFGVTLMTVEVLSHPLTYLEEEDGKNVTRCVTNIKHNKTNVCDGLLTKSDYLATLWTTAAEFPGLVITVLLLSVLSRRNTIRLEFLLVTVFYALLLKCDVSKTTTLLFIFGVRALITGVFQAVYVYTPEVYPTRVRALGLSMCSAVSRTGAMSTPFIADVVLRESLFNGKLIYTGISALGFLAACLLPIETKGKALGS